MDDWGKSGGGIESSVLKPSLDTDPNFKRFVVTVLLLA